MSSRLGQSERAELASPGFGRALIACRWQFGATHLGWRLVFGHRVGLMRCQLADEYTVGNQPLARVREQMFHRLTSSRSRDQRRMRLERDDFGGQVFDFVLGVFRWTNRVVGYAFTLVTDVYPPFQLSA